jgi:chromosome segregation ATPase
LVNENYKLKQTFDELKRKISDKNSLLARLEAEKKDLETTNVNILRKFKSIERDLKNSEKECQRLKLRSQRGAPYFSIIQEFFPKELPKFVDENHICKCY